MLHHMALRGTASRSMLAEANEIHDWRIYADIAQVLIHSARPMCTRESFGYYLDNTVYSWDSTTIDLCLAVFPWARFRTREAAVKLHTLLDVRCQSRRSIANAMDSVLQPVAVNVTVKPEPVKVN
jgi:hypothetical protein